MAGLQGIDRLTTGLERLATSIESANRKAEGAGGVGGGGGPLGALTSIGSSWMKSGATMALGFATNSVNQAILGYTANQRGIHDPAVAASMRAANYDPLGPLKHIPYVGTLAQSMVGIKKEQMERHAQGLGLMQGQMYSNLGDINSLRVQTTGAGIQLNREYTAAQKQYNLDLLQPKQIENEYHQWYSQVQSRLGKTRDTEKKMRDYPKYARNLEYSYNQEVESAASMVGMSDQYSEKYKHAQTLRAQAKERYTQATVGQYEVGEAANVGSVAAANPIGQPIEDKTVTELQTVNQTLTQIQTLFDGFIQTMKNAQGK